MLSGLCTQDPSRLRVPFLLIKDEFQPFDLATVCTMEMEKVFWSFVDVEFLRALGSQSGVSVWQHTLVG